MDVMKKAWEQARLAQSRFGGTTQEYFKEALAFSWMLEKLPEVWVLTPMGKIPKKVLQVPGKGRSKVIVLNASLVTLQDGLYVLKQSHCSTLQETGEALLIQTTVYGPSDDFLYTTQQWIPKSAIVFENYHYLKVKGFIKEAFLQPVHLILD